MIISKILNKSGFSAHTPDIYSKMVDIDRFMRNVFNVLRNLTVVFAFNSETKKLPMLGC